MMQSPPPPPPPLPQLPENRGLQGSSSATPMDDDVVEISPPVNRRAIAASQKQKEVITFTEIIDVDNDDDSMDIEVVDNNDKDVDESGKGKKAVPEISEGSSSGIDWKSVDKSYSSKEPVYFIDEDDYASDPFYVENEMLFEESALMDLSCDDYFNNDQYAMLQSHLDDLDVPPGVEVPVPWFMEHPEIKKKSTAANASNPPTSAVEWEEWGMPSDPASTLPSQLEKLHCESNLGGSSFGLKPKQLKSTGNWLPLYLPMSEPFSPFGKKATASSSGTANGSSNGSSTTEGSNSFNPPDYVSGRLLSKVPLMMSQNDTLIKFNKHYQKTIKRFSNGGAATDLSSFKKKKTNAFRAQHEAALKALSNLPEIPDVPVLLATNIPHLKLGPLHIPSKYSTSSPSAAEVRNGTFSCNETYGGPGEFLKKFMQFKRFDIVEDFSDHYYAGKPSSAKQAPKNWAKKIQDEWRILENDLPDAIFVRVYETRMDLMRAVIIGAEGTPYHDGLFFFDIIFPSNYPAVPPNVHYHSHGHRINPNLYNCGKVCLSLLNTWTGSSKEKWIPTQSTALQVLVSIQGLILNAKPYFNEPGYAHQSGTLGGEKSSREYNENTFIYSLKTMLAIIRNPPKYFKDFVAGHFFRRAGDILVACKAYVEGAQVGCLVRGGVQDVDEGDTCCSHTFKESVAYNMKTLVAAFKVVGATDLESFLSVEAKYVPPPPSRAKEVTLNRGGSKVAHLGGGAAKALAVGGDSGLVIGGGSEGSAKSEYHKYHNYWMSD